MPPNDEGSPVAAPTPIGPDALANALQTRVALVIGPGATHSSTVLTDLSTHLAAGFRVPEGATYLETADNVLNAGIPASALLDAMSAFLSSHEHHLDLSATTAPKWESVLSLCIDSAFDDALAEAETRRPVGRPATVLSDFRQPAPPRTVPVLKLFGSLQRRDFVHSTASYLTRRATWPDAVRVFAACAKGAPVLFLGVSDVPAFLYDLLAALFAQPTTIPPALLFSQEDPVINDPQVYRLVDGRAHIFSFDGKPEALVARTADIQRTGQQAKLPFPAAPGDADRDFSQFAGLVTLVNDHLTTSIDPTERNRLHELLFSSTQPTWDPYAHNLDFPRTIAPSILDELLLMAATRTPGSCACAVTGGAASGKTTLLKRLAFDLARREALVLWLSPWFYQDTQAVLVQLFEKLSTLSKRHQLRRPIIVMDDPLAFGVTTPTDVLTSASNAGVSVVLLIGVRTVDWGIRDTRDLVGSAPLMGHFALDDALDDTEEAALPGYLLDLGIYSTEPRAVQAVQESLSKYTRDVLSALYWLIPNTRQAITDSVRDEYFRLGDSAALTKVVIGKYEASSLVLRRAYEFVATAARYGSPLPIEVLVSALQVPYGDWLEAATPDGPAWGLLYPDSPDNEETLYYRPRNAVVADIVLRALNGGALSHGGEIAVLGQLLRACGGSQPQYREFCTRTLVPNSKLNQLAFDEGLRLYDAAIDALPLSDRTLLHHKGLWIKNKGHDPVQARATLTEALRASSYPFATKGEPDEHIYTSLAANEFDALDAGGVTFDDGQAAVRRYLAHARSTAFFNPRAVHVEARLIAQLLHKAKQGTSTGDRFRIANEALKDVDQTLLLLHGRIGNVVNQATGDDIAMLESQRAELLHEASAEEPLAETAHELWHSHRNQEGFVLEARRQYGDAVLADRGTLFNAAHSYCSETMDLVRQSGADPAPALFEVALLNYYHWQVARQTGPNRAERTIDWGFIVGASEAVLRAPTFEPLPHLYRYLRALGAAHLNDWTTATAIWGELRRTAIPRALMHERRDLLLTETGLARVLQGVVTVAGPRRFLKVDALGQDFVLAREQHWPRNGEIGHANIFFTFAGPIAVRL